MIDGQQIFLQLFFKILNNQNLNYCVLRNYEQLPYSLNGSDLDILVHGNEVNKFYEILNIILELSNSKIIIKYGKLAPRICIAGIIDKYCFGIQLDIHHGILPYKSFSMFPVDFLLERSKRYNEILVANDNDSDILAFLKEILNNKKCKKSYFIAAQRIWNSNEVYKDIFTKIYTKDFIDLFDAVMKDQFNEMNIKKLSALGRKNLTYGVAKQIIVLKSTLSKLYRFVNTPGFQIVVLGTDGAGKTTIINNITKPLKEAVHNALYYEHMRPNMIPNIAQLFGKKKEDGPVNNPHKLKSSGVFGSLLRLFYYSFDYIFGYLIKVYPVIVKKSSIWIFDRYYYDYMIDPRRARIDLPNWILKSMNFLIPKPDLILCFGANPKVIFSRKPELPLEEVKKQVEKLREFYENNENAVWIDTEKSIEESTNEVISVIVERMSKRYR